MESYFNNRFCNNNVLDKKLVEEEKRKFLEKQRLEDEERKRIEDEANKGILDILFEDPTLLAMGGGGLLLILGALAFLVIRKRKAKASVNDDYEEAGDTILGRNEKDRSPRGISLR